VIFGQFLILHQDNKFLKENSDGWQDLFNRQKELYLELSSASERLVNLCWEKNRTIETLMTARMMQVFGDSGVINYVWSHPKDDADAKLSLKIGDDEFMVPVDFDKHDAPVALDLAIEAWKRLKYESR